MGALRGGSAQATKIVIMLRMVLLSLVAASAAFPQGLSFGLKAGYPFKDVFNNRSTPAALITPASGRYTIGPVLELHLPFRTSVEFNALYRAGEFRRQVLGGPTLPDVTAGEWRFPVLFKYRFSEGLVTPFLGGGVSWQHLTGVDEPAYATNTKTGAVVAAGLEGRFPLIRLTGELRYTRWGAATLGNVISGLSQTNLNQVDALVGITF
jgi:hypothetical protein